jgi:P-type E1-E2 ATPase
MGNGHKKPAQELVPGDMVRIRSGDIVPADLKLFEGDYLQIDKSALTGECQPAEKKSDGIAYSGSAIQKGEMKKDTESLEEKIKADKKKIDEKKLKKVNITNLDAKIMKHKDGNLKSSYNCQVAVDEKEQIIVAADLVDEEIDANIPDNFMK